MFSPPITDWMLEYASRSANEASEDRPFKGHAGRISAIEYSPDNRFLATAGEDATVRLWDPHTGKQTRLLKTFHPVHSLSISRSGRQLAAICSAHDAKTSHVFVWSVEKHADTLGGELDVLKREYDSGDPPFGVHEVRFSPDGKSVAVMTPVQVVLQDAQSGDVLVEATKMIDRRRLVSLLAFSSRHLLFACRNRLALELYSFDLGLKQGTAFQFPGSTPSLDSPSLACSRDGSLLAGAVPEGGFQIWDTESGDVLHGPLLGHVDVTSSTCFSWDGEWVIDGSRAKTLCVWDCSTGALVLGSLGNRSQGEIRLVACSPGKDRIACVDDNDAIRVWDLESQKVILSSRADPPDESRTILCRSRHGWINSIQWFPDGRYFVSSSLRDDYIRTWDAESGRQVGELMFPGGSCIALSEDGSLLAAGSTRELGSIVLFNPNTGKKYSPPVMGPGSHTSKLQFSPNGSVLAVILKKGGTLHLVYDILGRRKVQLVQTTGAAVLDVAFSPDGEQFAYATKDDHSIRVCSVRTFEISVELKAQRSDTRSLSFSPSSQYLLVDGYADVKVWDLTTRQPVHDVRTEQRDTTLAEFSPDGRTFLTNWNSHDINTPNAGVELFDAVRGERLWCLQERENITALAFSPGGDKIVISFWDGPMKILEALTGKIILEGGKEDPSIRPEDLSMSTTRPQTTRPEDSTKKAVVSPDVDDDSILNMPATLSPAARMRHERGEQSSVRRVPPVDDQDAARRSPRSNFFTSLASHLGLRPVNGSDRKRHRPRAFRLVSVAQSKPRVLAGGGQESDRRHDGQPPVDDSSESSNPSPPTSDRARSPPTNEGEGENGSSSSSSNWFVDYMCYCVCFSCCR